MASSSNVVGGEPTPPHPPPRNSDVPIPHASSEVSQVEGWSQVSARFRHRAVSQVEGCPQHVPQQSKLQGARNMRTGARSKLQAWGGKRGSRAGVGYQLKNKGAGTHQRKMGEQEPRATPAFSNHIVRVLSDAQTEEWFSDENVLSEVSEATQNWTIEELQRRRELLAQVVHALEEVEYHRDSSSTSYEYEYTYPGSFA